MNETVEINLKEIGQGLLKRAWIIILCAVLLGTAVLIYTITCVTPMYENHVKMYVNSNYNSEADSITSSDLAVALRLVNSYAIIIREDKVLDPVAKHLNEQGWNVKSSQLKNMITTSVEAETEILKVTVKSSNPELSADVANAVADVAPDVIAQTVIKGSYAEPLNQAKVTNRRSSPNYLTSTLIGAVAGALLAVVAILVYMHFDVHVKNEAILESICKAPVLGVIPDFAEATKRNVKKAGR